MFCRKLTPSITGKNITVIVRNESTAAAQAFSQWLNVRRSPRQVQIYGNSLTNGACSELVIGPSPKLAGIFLNTCDAHMASSAKTNISVTVTYQQSLHSCKIFSAKQHLLRK